MADKKKARKIAKKERLKQQDQPSENEESTLRNKRNSHSKENRRDQDSKRNDELELLFAGEDEPLGNDYDMRELNKKAKADSKSKSKASKRNKRKAGDITDVAGEADVDGFAVDLSDSRFSGLLSKDGRFGIDTTSTEFKGRNTKEMKRLLEAQRTAAKTSTAAHANNTAAEDKIRTNKSAEHQGTSQLDTSQSLAERLKKKFKK
jgi:hypothetical protein